MFLVTNFRKDKMTKIQKQVEAAKKYKIESYGFGSPMPQRIVHQANARLMDFAFSLLGGMQ